MTRAARSSTGRSSSLPQRHPASGILVAMRPPQRRVTSRRATFGRGLWSCRVWRRARTPRCVALAVTSIALVVAIWLSEEPLHHAFYWLWPPCSALRRTDDGEFPAIVTASGWPRSTRVRPCALQISIPAQLKGAGKVISHHWRGSGNEIVRPRERHVHPLRVRLSLIAAALTTIVQGYSSSSCRYAHHARLAGVGGLEGMRPRSSSFRSR